MTRIEKTIIVKALSEYEACCKERERIARECNELDAAKEFLRDKILAANMAHAFQSILDEPAGSVRI